MHQKATIKTAEDVDKKLNLSFFDVVPFTDERKGPIYMTSDPKSATAEAYRTIRTGLMLSSAVKELKVILLTSATPNEGKTTTAVRAVDAYPVNAPLRYSVAMQHLLSGRKGDALEHARALAKLDDSYILRNPEFKTDMIERQTPGYLSMLAGSYLYSALEIAWRVSKDPEVVKGIAPDNPDAARVVQLFLASRRISAP